MKLTHAKEGLRMLTRALRVHATSFKKYTGSPKEICAAIVSDCWNGAYYQTSRGHFNQFYSRDFSWCTESLITLGHKEKVRQTLRYALERFKRHGAITTSITPSGTPFNFPAFGIDSVASITHSLVLLDDKELTKDYVELINKEVKKVFSYLDEQGLVKKEAHLSSIKDHDKRESSCYDTCMLGLLSKNLAVLGLDSPLQQYDYKKILQEYYWTGNYFLDDLSGKKHISADAQVFPFWTTLTTNKKQFNTIVQTLEQETLTTPFPLRYTKEKSPHKRVGISLLVPGYEGTTPWAHIGMIYLQLLKTYDHPSFEKHHKTYTKLITHHKTFLEVYTTKGKPYKTPFYITDEGMLWASNYLTL